MMLIKYSRRWCSSSCDYLEELELERHPWSSRSVLTRFGLINWVQLWWNLGDHPLSALSILSFFAIKPFFHFYLYFTVRNFIGFVLNYFGCRFR
jgi:hypothetical protein